MIKFGGEHAMKVNVINKPIRGFYGLIIFFFLEGFRAFVLCESVSGYVLNWFLDRSS